MGRLGVGVTAGGFKVDFSEKCIYTEEIMRKVGE